MLLFGGAVGFEQRADTWAWDGETWSLVTQTGPRPRFVSLMTEDRATGDVLLQGGHWVAGNDGDFLADTWRWDTDTWIEIAGADGPGPRVNAPGTWDERLGGIVMFGGGVDEREPMASDTWLWTDGWTELESATAPGPRGGHQVAFDAKRQVLVLVGGIAEAGGSQTLDVWELDADGWNEVLRDRRRQPEGDGEGLRRPFPYGNAGTVLPLREEGADEPSLSRSWTPSRDASVSIDAGDLVERRWVERDHFAPTGQADATEPKHLTEVQAASIRCIDEQGPHPGLARAHRSSRPWGCGAEPATRW